MNYTIIRLVVCFILVTSGYTVVAAGTAAQTITLGAIQFTVVTDSLRPLEIMRTSCDRIALELKAAKEEVADLKAYVRSREYPNSGLPSTPGGGPRPEPRIVPDPNSVPISEVERYLVQLNNARVRIGELRAENSDLRLGLDEALNDAARLRNENEVLSSDLEEARRIIEELRDEIARQNRQIAELNATIREQAAEIDRLNEEIKVLVDDYKYMVNQFNRNSTTLYASYDFPRMKEDDYYYIEIGRKILPRDAKVKVKNIKAFHVKVQLFIPANVPEYKVGLKIQRDGKAPIIVPISLKQNISVRRSHLGFYFYKGFTEFTEGLPERKSLGNLFKKRERFYEKDKHYTYEIVLDLPDDSLKFPEGSFFLY